MRSRVILGLMAIAMLLISQTASASAGQSDVADVINGIAKRYGEAKSYHVLGVMLMDVSAQGQMHNMEMSTTIVGEKPSKFRVELDSSVMGKVFMVCDGNYTWNYEPKSNRYSKIEMVPLKSATDTGLGGGAGFVEKYANLDERLDGSKLIGEEALQFEGKKVSCTIIYVPPTPDTLARMHTLGDTMWVTDDRRVIRECASYTMTAPNGEVKSHQTLEFTKVDLDGDVDPALFVFEPPADATEVKPEDFRPRDKGNGLVGTEAPEFRLDDLDDRTYSLSDLRGRVVLLDFWATWCGPCRIEMPHIQRLYNQFKDDGLVVLGINSESPETARSFMKENSYTFPSLSDADYKVAAQYHVEGLPTVVIIDRDGKIASYFKGMRPEDTLREALRSLGLE